VWLHYFALLIVALGVLQPRYSPLWLVPFVLFAPARPPAPNWWAVVLVAVFAAMLIRAHSREHRRVLRLSPPPAGSPQ
jgi:hypothetical protein